jgi:glutamate synthase domain-containing protein 3
MRERMARAGIRRLRDVVGRRDLLVRRADLRGKAALIDTSRMTSAPAGRERARRLREQSEIHAPRRRVKELELVDRAIAGEAVETRGRLTNRDRCVGVGAAGEIARRFGDAGLPEGRLVMRHHGAAGHFYGAYALSGMELRIEGLVADSAFTAAYGGKIVIVPDGNGKRRHDLTVAGNAFGYGARRGSAYLAGKAGNRFAIALRKSHEGDGPRLVVEGVEANAFQYMTGGVALVLGPVGDNFAAGMSGGMAYVYDPDERFAGHVNQDMVIYQRIEVAHYEDELRALLTLHVKNTQSRFAERILAEFDRELGHFWQIVPKEMLDKLEVPITRESAAALTA